MKQNPSYYAILTADVRYDKRLSSSEKLFYAEITALSDKEGYCWASNKYFADLYGVARSTVSGWVNTLDKLGYIRVSYIKEGKQIKSRKITPVRISEQGWSENQNRGGQKTEQGWSENPKGNTTSKNTTSNNSSIPARAGAVDMFGHPKTIPPQKEHVCRYFMKLDVGKRRAIEETEKFFDHYTSNGWKVGKTKMVDWMAAVRQWKKRLKDFNPNQSAKRNGHYTNQDIAQNAVEAVERLNFD